MTAEMDGRASQATMPKSLLKKTIAESNIIKSKTEHKLPSRKTRDYNHAPKSTCSNVVGERDRTQSVEKSEHNETFSDGYDTADDGSSVSSQSVPSVSTKHSMKSVATRASLFSDSSKGKEKVLRAKHENACRYLKTGKLDKAQQKFEEILSSHISQYGEKHHRVGAALHNIGIVHLRSGRFDKAIDAFEEAIRIRKKTLGKYHTKVSDSLIELGIVLLSRRDFDESLEIFQEALEMREHEYERSSDSGKSKINLQIAKILNNIGCVYFEFGEFGDAKEAYEESLEIQRDFYCSKDSNDPAYLAMASTLCNLAYSQIEENQWTEAIKNLKEALSITDSLLEPSNKQVMSSLENLAFAYAKNGNHDSAITTNLDILEVQRNTAKEDLRIINTLKQLVYSHLKLYKYEKAEDYLIEIKNIQQKNVTEESQEDLFETERLLSTVYYQIHKFPGPLELLMQSLTSHGLRNPLTSRTCSCACVDPESEEMDLRHFAPKQPQVTSKMSGHKVSYA